MRKDLYKLTKAEREIFDRTPDNPNLFTNWYFKGPNTGTWAYHDADDKRYLLLHKALMKRWIKLDRPQKFDFTYSQSEVPLVPFKSASGQVFQRGLAMPTIPTPILVKFKPLQKIPYFQANHGLWLQDWQLEIMKLMQTGRVLIGGYGCLAAETEIWDVELGRGVAVEQLVREQRAPVVLAWDGNQFVPIRASIPWIKGVDDLYEVTTVSGRKITTTLQHKFLTDQGWMTLEQIQSCASMPRLLASSPNLQESTQGISHSELPQDVQRYSQITQDSLSDYHWFDHFCDGQPQWEVNSDPALPPLQDDAPLHIPPWFYTGGQATKYRYNPVDERYLYPLATSHSVLPSGHLVLPQGYFYYGGIGANVPSSASLRVSREPQEYDGNSYPRLQSDVFDLQTDRTNSVFLDAYKSPFSVEPKPPTIIEPILSIEKVRTDIFYDIHVPIYENYLAEGFINHNSSKTSIAELDMEIKAATLPGFQGFCMAPSAMQSTAIYKKMMGRMSGTLYGERFLLRNTRKQPESVVVGNDYTGECGIDFYSIQDNPDKVLNLEGDMAIIDQTEQLYDIPTTRGNVVSRLRGNHQGRDRIGLVYWIANPNDNPELWNLADDADEHPKELYYRQIATYENWALTDKQLRDYEGNIAPGDKNTQNSKLLGFRPKGGGKQFPEASIDACLSPMLDELMDKGIEAGKKGYIKVEYPKLGICQWELPPEDDHMYIVLADPGQDNPPNRNTAAVGVWDITGFPERPAQLAAFNWVFGNNSPIPWMQTFFDYVARYKAVGRCGYDSTGWQSGYQGWVETFAKIQSTGMNMNESNKFMHLNSAQQLMTRGKIKFPTIQAMLSQLAKYDIPDKKLRQDIVVMIMLTCTWLQQYFYMNQPTDDKREAVGQDRYQWRNTSRRATRFR